MKSRISCIICIFCLSGIFNPAIGTDIVEENLRRHMLFLGSDSLQGRGTGTAGSARSAEYIAALLEKYELIPLAEDNSYYQAIPMHGSLPLSSSVLKFVQPDTTRLLVLKEQYLLYQSGAQTFIPNPIPLVFVGYGIIAPEYDYNDYQSVDVEGKIVVFIDGEPESVDKTFFQGNQTTIYSAVDTKQRLALSRGAHGSILIPSLKTAWPEWQRAFAFENITLAYNVSGHLSMMINPETAALLFDGAEYSLDQIYTNVENGFVNSFDLQTRISFEGKFTERDFLERNVVAMREGSDPELKNTYILLSAHYDHLGIGPAVNGDSIYNGVFDNAGGVAALLEIARFLSENTIRHKRSVVFLFLTGEEMGLLGSTYYTDHPLVPLYKTVANINIDGLALFEEFNEVITLGDPYSTIASDLDQVLTKMNLKRMTDENNLFVQPELINRSDHFAFAKAGIPFLCLVEGLSYKNSTVEEGLRRIRNWSENRYHTPFDDLNQSMDIAAGVKHTKVILNAALYLANQNKEPQWKTGSPFINRRLQTIAEKR